MENTMNIITKKDFFKIKESDIMDENEIQLIVNQFKLIRPARYKTYGENTIINYAKHVLLEKYRSGSLVEIKENVYVKWEDFIDVIRFENGKIVHRFIGGLYSINLYDKSGNDLNKKLSGILLIDFKE